MKRVIKVTSVVDIDDNCFTVEAYLGYFTEGGNFVWTDHATADGTFKRIKVGGEPHILVESFEMDGVGILNPFNVDMLDVERSLEAYLVKRSA